MEEALNDSGSQKHKDRGPGTCPKGVEVRWAAQDLSAAFDLTQKWETGVHNYFIFDLPAFKLQNWVKTYPNIDLEDSIAR